MQSIGIHPTAVTEAPSRLEEREKRIESAKRIIVDAYYIMGEELKAIQAEEDWKRDYLTWKDYLVARWGMTPSTASRLISAAENRANVLPIGNPPENEYQARQLNSLEPDMQQIAWQLVKQSAPGGKITAAHVQSVVTVLQNAVRTGAIDPGDGEQIPLSQAIRAEVIEETYERMKRQEAHIQERQQKKTGGAPQKTSPNALTLLSDVQFTVAGADRATMRVVLQLRDTIAVQEFINWKTYNEQALSLTVKQEGAK